MPHQRGDGPAVVDIRLVAQVAGRLPRCGRADHLAAGRLERGTYHVEHRGLARAGDPHNNLGAPPRATDLLGRPTLSVGEPSTEMRLGGIQGHHRVGGWSVYPFDEALDAGRN